MWVSRQLGHESPNTTLRVYAHLFDGAEHAEWASAALAANFGSILEARGGEQTQDDASRAGGQVAFLSGVASNGN